MKDIYPIISLFDQSGLILMFNQCKMESYIHGNTGLSICLIVLFFNHLLVVFNDYELKY
jgi:hypothetical protein